jgi:antitoxin component YwqK of YwqJK toxin-antitoxin module
MVMALRIVCCVLAAMAATAVGATRPATSQPATSPAPARGPQTRGERIICDPNLFDAGYGQGMLKSLDILLDSDIRDTCYSDDFFTARPPLAKVIAKYGRPDFVRPSRDHYWPKKGQDFHKTTHYFDRIGLVTFSSDGHKVVRRVEVQDFDYSAMKPRPKGKTFLFIAYSHDKVFYEDGRELGRHVHDPQSRRWVTSGKMPDGVYACFLRGRKVVETHLKANAGEFRSFHENGQAHVVSPFRDGCLQGPTRAYYESGKLLAEVPYVDGQVHGVAKEYYETGELLTEKPCVRGELHGLAREYYRSGKIKKKLLFENGQPKGNIIWFNEKGEVIGEQEPAPAGEH